MIKLKIVGADDPVRLTALKSRFNRLATQLNRMVRMKPEEDPKKLQDGLKALEDQINSFAK
ncbi:hypothetical protein Q0590_24415 [Rhodocytophaga aerolata]|uniref:Uncharacterized protein n=1 Tax=Rhodocytophaga aerolata TaxID=455078 RepID=A0ABT8RFE4_9BACT|nr:hypothetical protein [Rhodocytophaga aerolata]MDO1449442.1 hypothetical protein [Rhodocytophaga aerolata]